ncbi:MAG: hypothetical protein ABFQ53_01065 [Patescibacteria group bacterium]
MSNKKLFIISGPSGAGEDSIIKGLRELLNINVPTTTTTRKMREGESEGRPYYFISKESFKKGVLENKFFEWTKQDNENLYGVTHVEIDDVRSKEGVGILKVDYNGVITAKKLLGDDVIAILINCPLNQIAERLKKRDNASEEFVSRRLKYAKGWLENKDVFDYEVINDDGNLEKSVAIVYDIIQKNTK